MTASHTLAGPEAGPEAGGDRDSLVLLLHGLGANGQDLFGLVPNFQAVLPHSHFIAPNAPERCDMMPPGYEPAGYQWFSFQDRSPHAIWAGVLRAADVLNGFIDAQLNRFGLDESRLALIGFSQGTMMSLHVALRRPRAVAGVLGFSGTLAGPGQLAEQIQSRPPVLLIHGEADEVLPFDNMASSAESLRAQAVPVDTYARPRLGHSIDGPGMMRGGHFLARVLAG